jgi:hypothetical protein
MKKLIMSFALVAIAAVSFGQTSSTISYDSLDVASQKLFSKYGVANPYGEIIKFEADSIVAIYEITDIKKSRKMVADSVGVKSPEFSTQYMTIYLKDGEMKAFVSLENPTTLAKTAGVSVAAYFQNTGLRQGDDEFGVPTKPSTQSPYLINPEW